MKKILVFTLAVGMMMTINNSALAIDASFAGGSGAHFNGKDVVSTDAVDGLNAVTNWNKFNIQNGQTLTNQFNGQNQHILFKVNGSAPSVINGTWNASGVGAATGRTTLLNPNGVMVGNGAVILIAEINSSVGLVGQDFRAVLYAFGLPVVVAALRRPAFDLIF